MTGIQGHLGLGRCSPAWNALYPWHIGELPETDGRDGHFSLMHRLLAVLLLAVTPSLANAWSACGHHTVALIAYDLLSEDDQVRLRELLAEHPRFAEDFEPAPKVRDKIRFQVGTSGYWPDIARSQSEYNRPKWHYEPGPTLTIGNVTPIERPGPLPADATLETRDLHLSQADGFRGLHGRCRDYRSRASQIRRLSAGGGLVWSECLASRVSAANADGGVRRQSSLRQLRALPLLMAQEQLRVRTKSV